MAQSQSTLKAWLACTLAGAAAGGVSVAFQHYVGVALLSVFIIAVHVTIDLSNGRRFATAIGAAVAFAMVLTVRLVVATTSTVGTGDGGAVAIIAIMSGGLFLGIGLLAAIFGALVGIGLQRK